MSIDNSVALSIAAIAFSLFSVAFTAYQQYFKRPSIAVMLGRRMTVFYGSTGYLGLNITVVFRNKGAQYGMIRAVAGTIFEGEPGNGRPISFGWSAFLKGEQDNLVKTGEGFQPFERVECFAESLVVPSRSVISKRIEFVTTEKFQLEDNHYVVQISVLEGLRKSVAATATATFDVTTGMLDKIPLVDKDSHLVKNLVVVPLEMKIWKLS